VDEDTWHEFVLPTCKGGLSLRTKSIHASAAYLASVDGSYSLAQSLYALDYFPVALSEAVVDFNARAPQAPLYVEDFPYLQTPLVQRELSAGIELVILAKVLQDATLEKRAWFSSLGVPDIAA